MLVKVVLQGDWNFYEKVYFVSKVWWFWNAFPENLIVFVLPNEFSKDSFVIKPGFNFCSWNKFAEASSLFISTGWFPANWQAAVETAAKVAVTPQQKSFSDQIGNCLKISLNRKNNTGAVVNLGKCSTMKKNLTWVDSVGRNCLQYQVVNMSRTHLVCHVVFMRWSCFSSQAAMIRGQSSRRKNQQS